MTKRNVLAVGLLLSVGIMGFISVIKAKDENQRETSRAAASASGVKTDVNTVIDVSGSMTPIDLNIRYIDVFGAMRDSKEGKEASEKLDLKRDELGKGIEVVRAKYEAVVTEFKTKAATMNDQARAKKEQEIVKLKRDYESGLQGAEEEMKLVMQQVTEALAKEVEQAVIDLAKKEGLDAVVDKVTGRVIYASNKADYTTKVVQSMDKHYSVKLANNEKSAASTITVASTKKSPSAA